MISESEISKLICFELWHILIEKDQWSQTRRQFVHQWTSGYQFEQSLIAITCNSQMRTGGAAQLHILFLTQSDWKHSTDLSLPKKVSKYTLSHGHRHSYSLWKRLTLESSMHAVKNQSVHLTILIYISSSEIRTRAISLTVGRLHIFTCLLVCNHNVSFSLRSAAKKTCICRAQHLPFILKIFLAPLFTESYHYRPLYRPVLELQARIASLRWSLATAIASAVMVIFLKN